MPVRPSTASVPPARSTPQDVEGLVDAAVRVFVERGYEGSSMEDIAREAGLAKSSIYHHVSGKRELLDRAIERAIDESETVAAAIEAFTDDPAEQLWLVARRVIEKASEDSPSQAILRRVPLMSPSVPGVMERYRRHEQAVVRFIHRAAEAGAIRSDIEPLLLNRLLWLMTGAVADVRRIDPEIDLDELIEAGLSILRNGVEPKRRRRAGR